MLVGTEMYLRTSFTNENYHQYFSSRNYIVENSFAVTLKLFFIDNYCTTVLYHHHHQVHRVTSILIIFLIFFGTLWSSVSEFSCRL